MLSSGLLLVEVSISPCCERLERWKESRGARSINPVLCTALHRSQSVLKGPQDDWTHLSWLPLGYLPKSRFISLHRSIDNGSCTEAPGREATEQLATLASLAAADLPCTRDMPRWWKEVFSALWDIEKKWRWAEKCIHNVVIIVLVLENFMVVTQMSKHAEISVWVCLKAEVTAFRHMDYPYLP